jgi:hypothetical protein
MRRLRLVLTGAFLVVLAGCSGVPSSSAPETVEALDTGGAARSQVPPNLVTGDARTIVSSFLDENAATTMTHPLASAYLTDAARTGWSDATATIIADDRTIGLYNSRNHTVTVLGRVLGTLNADGVYKPSRQGEGQGGDRQPFVFHLVQLPNNQWRIDRLQSGLLLTDDQFRNLYRQQVLYFYDLGEDALVPDLRWSALDDRVQWSQWLLRELAAGPRPELADAVSPDTLPPNIDPQDIKVTLGTPTLIEIPGSSQLDASVRDRLAAQVSQTLIEALSGREITITDNAVPVQIPQVGGTTFSASDFASTTGPSLPTSEVYYLTSGRVRDDAGHLLAGPLGDGHYYLTSFAIGQPEPGGQQYAAGVITSGGVQQAYVGTVRGGLRATSVQGTAGQGTSGQGTSGQGPLSRPAFAPGRPEVWIASGAKLLRIEADTPQPRVYPVPIPSGGARIVALRFSPDGSRIAVVLARTGGEQQLYVGAIIRAAGQVRVGTLVPISPKGVVVTDVAWLESFKLFAIGELASSGDPRTFETGSDGTDWTNSTLGNLPAPGRPDTVTAATASNVWVSANGYVWKLSGSSWVSPGTTGQTPGMAPVYLE